MTTTHEHRVLSDRYTFDFGACSYDAGYAQVDTTQDAPYFGTWVSPEERKIVCFAEGDLTIQHAASDEEFVAAVRELERWNREREYWKGIDVGLAPRLKTKLEALGLGDLAH